MAETRGEEKRRPAGPPAIGDPLPYDEDFLFHLSRGSELLLENRVVEAKEQLERALGFQPRDAKGQDLLAGVYFRLGLYPRAIELWTELLVEHGDDVTLRLNLGLALLKTGQPDVALAHLAKVLAKDPQHERAWRYVGLAEWRVGNLDRARDAFLRGGQASMAKRMEDLLGVSAAPEPVLIGGDGPSGEIDVKEMAERAIGRLAVPDVVERSPDDASPVPLRRDARPSSVPRMARPWGVAEPIADADGDADPEPGAEPIPHRPVVGASLASLVRERDLETTVGAALRVVSGGSLALVADAREIIARKRGLAAVRGAPARDAVPRGGAQGGTLGGESPMYRWSVPSLALFVAPEGERFSVLRLEGDCVTLAERAVFAFDGALAFEPVAASATPLLELRGHGGIALSTPRPWSAIVVPHEDEARVHVGSLVGWVGPLVPRRSDGDDPDFLVLRGEGTLLVV